MNFRGQRGSAAGFGIRDGGHLAGRPVPLR